MRKQVKNRRCFSLLLVICMMTALLAVNPKEVRAKEQKLQMEDAYATLQNIGDSVTLNAGVKASWTSENKEVASVNSKGQVVAKGYGHTKIVASYQGKTVTCEVRVPQPINTLDEFEQALNEKISCMIVTKSFYDTSENKEVIIPEDMIVLIGKDVTLRFGEFISLKLEGELSNQLGKTAKSLSGTPGKLSYDNGIDLVVTSSGVLSLAKRVDGIGSADTGFYFQPGSTCIIGEQILVGPVGSGAVYIQQKNAAGGGTICFTHDGSLTSLWLIEVSGKLVVTSRKVNSSIDAFQVQDEGTLQINNMYGFNSDKDHTPYILIYGNGKLYWRQECILDNQNEKAVFYWKADPRKLNISEGLLLPDTSKEIIVREYLQNVGFDLEQAVFSDDTIKQKYVYDQNTTTYTEKEWQKYKAPMRQAVNLDENSRIVVGKTILVGPDKNAIIRTKSYDGKKFIGQFWYTNRLVFYVQRGGAVINSNKVWKYFNSVCALQTNNHTYLKLPAATNLKKQSLYYSAANAKVMIGNRVLCAPFDKNKGIAINCGIRIDDGYIRLYPSDGFKQYKTSFMGMKVVVID